MKIEIKNRFTDKIIIEGEAESVKEFLEKNWDADLQDADLRGVNLQDADLRGINFQDADLRDANLQGTKIRITQKEDLIKSLGIKIVE